MINGWENGKGIQKLRELLASRFGKGFQLRLLADANRVPGSDEAITVKGMDLHIPLRVKDTLLGTAVVKEGADLEEEKRAQVSDMIRMVLEPSLYKEFLERQETNLITQKTLTILPDFADEEDDEDSNLRFLDNPYAGSDDTADLPRLLGRPQLVSNLLHLYGHDSERLKRAGLMIHEMTNRWAFVPWDDVCNGINSVEEILKLGAMTLFVESVEALPKAQQQLILDYVASPRAESEPLFITGSATKIDDLTQVEVLLPEIKDELSANAIDLDRAPLTERGLKELLSLMFFDGPEN